MPINHSVSCVPTAPFMSGKNICKNVLKYPQPSSFAASIRSFGMLVKFCRRKNTMLTLPKQAGIISGSSVSVHLRLVNITYWGIMITAKGIIIVANNPMNIAPFPLNSILANAKAARDEVKPPMSSTGTSTFTVFKTPDIKLPLLITSEYLPQTHGSGITLSCPDKYWFFVINEVIII